MALFSVSLHLPPPGLKLQVLLLNSGPAAHHLKVNIRETRTTQERTTHGHHQTVNTQIRLIIFFAAKDGEALYSQQKQDQELTVAHVMNILLPNSDLN